MLYAILVPACCLCSIYSYEGCIIWRKWDWGQLYATSAKIQRRSLDLSYLVALPVPLILRRAFRKYTVKVSISPQGLPNTLIKVHSEQYSQGILSLFFYNCTDKTMHQSLNSPSSIDAELSRLQLQQSSLTDVLEFVRLLVLGPPVSTANGKR